MTALALFDLTIKQTILAFLLLVGLLMWASWRSVRPEPPAVNEPASHLSDPHTRPGLCELFDWEEDA